jgi:hypothetical protein
VSRSIGAVIEWLKSQFHRIVNALRGRADNVAQDIFQKAEKWLKSLIASAAQSDAGTKAVIEGIRAALTGKNPVWAATKALISGLSGKAKVGLALLLLLALLLAPVLLVVLLLVLVVAALVAAVRAAAQ